jgi:glycopeptide antibiotics resistance protein
MDLLQCYLQPSGNSSRDVVVNIVGFIPVGTLVGFLSRRYRVMKALLAGVMVSLAIECSQLIWKKGVFDVDDLMNNAMGSLLGGLIVVMVIRMLAR